MAKLLRPSHKQYEIQITRIEKEDPYMAPEMLGQIWYNNTTNTAYIGTGSNKDSWEVIGGLEQLFEYTDIPTGFKDNTKAETSFNNGTRTFTIQPKAPATFYEISVAGETFVKTVAESVAIPDVTNTYYFYFDITGTLNYRAIPVTDLFINNCICGMVYYNATLNEAQIVASNERHSAKFPPMTHAYNHEFLGTQYASGLGLTNFTIGTGSSDDDWKYRCASGLIYDEDIRLSISEVLTTGQIPVLYRLGTEWTKDTTYDRVVNDGSGRLMYNQNGTTLTEVTNNDFMLMFVIATNDTDFPVMVIMGQQQYSNINNLRNNAPNEINSLITNGLPVEEFIFVGAIAYQTNSTYTNSTKSKIVQIDGADYLDYRTAKTISIRASVTDHGSLSGLSDDDHSQYALLSGRHGDILNIDTINEKTLNNGVTIDGVTLKDGGGTFTDDINADTIGTTGATSFNIKTNGINKISVNTDGIVSMPNQANISMVAINSLSLTANTTDINFTSDEIDPQAEFNGTTYVPDVSGKVFISIQAQGSTGKINCYEDGVLYRNIIIADGSPSGGRLIPVTAGNSYTFRSSTTVTITNRSISILKEN